MTLRTVGAGTSITTGTATQQSSPISGKSTALRVVATGQNTFVAIGTEPSATATDFVVPANSAATLAFSNTSAKVVSISTATTYTYIDFPQGTASPFAAGDYVSLDLADGSDQDYYNFTHKRVKSVDVSFTPNASSGYGRRIRIIDAYTGVGIATAFSADKGASPRDAKLRSSLKVAGLRTASTNGQINCQQVQIVGG